MMRYLSFALAFFVNVSLITAQKSVEEPINIQNDEIDNHIANWKVYKLDAEALYVTALQQLSLNSDFQLRVGEHQWQLTLTDSELFDPGYFTQFFDGQQSTRFPLGSLRALQGSLVGQKGSARLTLDHNFFSATINEADEKYLIEPYWYHDASAPKDWYLIYPHSAVKDNHEDHACGVDDSDMFRSHVETQLQQAGIAEKAQACFKLDLAIASDASMLTKYGTNAAVIAHNVAVINDVEGDYTGNFNNDIEFNIVTQFVASTNPWTANTAAGTYLNNFRSWGNGGGFGVPFDLGELWTNLDFDGQTIGIAFVGSVCTNSRYHCLQDFTNSPTFLRCLTSHEIGHNFNAQHDNCTTADFIMCPFVSAATDWSVTTTNVINNFTNVLINNGCLSGCSSGPPPVPNFTWEPNPACATQPVSFIDQSAGTINTYNWTFQGGIPATSTAPEPTVTWNTPGVKNVTLTLNNGTSTQAVITKQVTVIALPTANFTSTYSGLTYNFTSTSTNATFFDWDFGDGITSNLQNPSHTYEIGGVYTVTLVVSNNCGDATRIVTINTVPSPDFVAEPAVGCAPLNVEMNNLSTSNAISYTWQFPGASPSSSTQKNPTVVYNTPGNYTVTLTAFNAAGSAVLSKTAYINAGGPPTNGNFNFAANGLTVNFTATGNNVTEYFWDFGDGNTSNLSNPVHTYSVGGNYEVILTLSNNCGDAQRVRTVVLQPPPVAGFTAQNTTGCAPLTVNFTNTSTGNANSYLWQLPGGTPSTSTLANPTVVYNAPGTYNVTLTATNAGGSNTETQAQFVSVNSGPTAAFTAQTNGLSVNFTNNSTNATAYSWNFGNNTSSNNLNPVATYSTAGTYTVTLTASSACGMQTATQTVQIVQAPTANFSVSTTTGCGPLTVQFNNTSTGSPTAFNWQFPGGTPATSTLPNPMVVYSNPGTYTVSLTASNTAGSGVLNQQALIVVNGLPNPAFGATVNGNNVVLSNNSTNALSYSWAASNGTSSSMVAPTLNFPTDGNYTVTLTATNACGTASVTQNITIANPPIAGFNVGTNTVGCAPFTVSYQQMASANTTGFNWSFPGGTPTTSTLPNPTVVYNLPGTYSAALTVTNATGSSTSAQNNLIQVGALPTANFLYQSSGTSVTFTNSSLDAAQFNWNFGNGSTSTQANPTHNFGQDGTYTVTLTATNGCGSSSATQTVTIVTPPTANFTANNTLGCAPLTVNFNNTSSSNATQFNWTFPGGSPGSSTLLNPVVTYAAAGTYPVTLQVTNATGVSTVSQLDFVVVKTVPQPAFTVVQSNGVVSLANTSTEANSYLWNFGDGGSSTQVNPTHLYTTPGTYTIALTAFNSCGSSTASQLVIVTLPPTAGFTAENVAGCAPLTVAFANTSQFATDYLWTFPGGTPASSTEANPVVTYSEAGTFSVNLQATNSVGVALAQQNELITVNSTPTANFSLIQNNAFVVLNNQSTNADNVFWNFGNGITSIDNNPTFLYPQAGNYAITMIAQNTCGADTSVQQIVVEDGPTAGFTAAANSGCAPLTVQYTNNSSANVEGYNWVFEGGEPATSTEVNPVVTYNTVGSFDVSLTVNNIAGTNTFTQENWVTVLPLPEVNISLLLMGDSLFTDNNSVSVDSVVWNFGDGSPVVNVFEPIHHFAANGTYTVTYTAYSTCDTLVEQKVVTVNVVSTRPDVITGNWRVYPNPNEGTFTVEISGMQGPMLRYRLLDVLGRELMSGRGELDNGAWIKHFVADNLSAGTYIFEAQTGTQWLHAKVLIQR
jgi:PKD repeat protein